MFLCKHVDLISIGLMMPYLIFLSLSITIVFFTDFSHQWSETLEPDPFYLKADKPIIVAQYGLLKDPSSGQFLIFFL